MTTNHSSTFLQVYNYLNTVIPNTCTAPIYTDVSAMPKIVFQSNLIEYVGDFGLYLPYILLTTIISAGFGMFFLQNSVFTSWFSSAASLSEKELNALDDLLVSVVIFLTFFFYNFVGCATFVLPLVHNLTFYSLGLALVISLVSIPTSMIYNFGFYFVVFIRGGASSLSFLYELILDYINIISFLLRLLIQLVRIIVIGVIYYMYNHLFFVYQYVRTPTTYGSSYYLATLDGTVATWLRLVFEIGHTFIIFLIQFCAFTVMILWLFQFLFTLFFSQNMELSFTHRPTL